MEPLVSVVITTYNQARYIEETLAIAIRQSYENREVIVVDDGSTDDTGGRVARFRGDVTYLRQRNQGVAGSRNTGVRRARGELLVAAYLAGLWSPEWMRRVCGRAVRGLLETGDRRT